MMATPPKEPRPKASKPRPKPAPKGKATPAKASTPAKEPRPKVIDNKGRHKADAAREKRMVFAREYLVDLNATQAAIRAGFSEKTATSAGHRLLTYADVQAEVTKLKAERAEKLGINAEDALRLIWARATADPRELVEVKVGCCRHCYGIGHGYQRTMVEMANAREKWAEKGNNPGDFDEQGGIGFDPRKPPSESCPECHGDGEPRVVLKDTRSLTPEAAALYAGAKHGKNGIEIALHDQGKHLEMAGRHLNLWKDKLELEVKTELADRLARARANASRRV